jgi:protease-4
MLIFSDAQGGQLYNALFRQGISMSHSERQSHRDGLDKLIFHQSANIIDRYYHSSESLQNLQQSTVGIVNMPNILTRNGSWFSKGTSHVIQELKALGGSDNISQVVIKSFDVYGGSVNGIEELSQLVGDFEKLYNKPLSVLMDGITASGGYFSVVKAKKIYMGSQMTIVGSIGTMVSYSDYSEADKMQGIKHIEVYATDSVNKNIESRDEDNGNFEKRIELLDATNDVFKQAVIEGRGKRLNVTTQVENSKGDMIAETLSGKIYIGQKVIEMGLADGFSTIDKLIEANTKIQTNKFFIK